MFYANCRQNTLRKSASLESFLGIGERRPFFLESSFRNRVQKNWRQYKLDYLLSFSWIFALRLFFLNEDTFDQLDLLAVFSISFCWSHLVRRLSINSWRRGRWGKWRMNNISQRVFPFLDLSFCMEISHQARIRYFHPTMPQRWLGSCYSRVPYPSYSSWHSSVQVV